MMRRFDEALADCNSVIEKQPKNQYVLANRGDAYLAKGDLDAALNDYNAILQLIPEQCPRPCRPRPGVRAQAGPGPGARRLPLGRRCAHAVRRNRRLDGAHHGTRPRLAALEPQSAWSSVGTLRRVALVVGNGAYRNVHALEQSATRFQADRGRASRCRLPDGDVVERSEPGPVLRGRCMPLPRMRRRLDWALLYYAGHGFEIGAANYLVPVDARLAVDKDAEKEAVPLRAGRRRSGRRAQAAPGDPGRLP